MSLPVRPKSFRAAGDSEELRAVSVRRHAGFGLIPRELTTTPSCEPPPPPEAAEPITFEWWRHELRGGGHALTRQRKEGKVTLQDMIQSRETKVDNTGNVCLWPSEEVMTWHLLEHKKEMLEGEDHEPRTHTRIEHLCVHQSS